MFDTNFPGVENVPLLDPEDVSQAVMYALSTRPHVQVKIVP